MQKIRHGASSYQVPCMVMCRRIHSQKNPVVWARVPARNRPTTHRHFRQWVRSPFSNPNRWCFCCVGSPRHRRFEPPSNAPVATVTHHGNRRWYLEMWKDRRQQRTLQLITKCIRKVGRLRSTRIGLNRLTHNVHQWTRRFVRIVKLHQKVFSAHQLEHLTSIKIISAIAHIRIPFLFWLTLRSFTTKCGVSSMFWIVWYLRAYNRSLSRPSIFRAKITEPKSVNERTTKQMRTIEVILACSQFWLDLYEWTLTALADETQWPKVSILHNVVCVIQFCNRKK